MEELLGGKLENIQWARGLEKYICTDPQEYYERLAVEFLENAERAVQSKGCFTAVLGGGNTPRYINSKIVERSAQYKVNWNDVYIVLSDERWVKESDRLSNYKMISESLVVPLKTRPLHKIYTAGSTVEEAAERFNAYIEDLRIRTGQNGFDYALLGVGPDGHTASLFPYRQQVRSAGANVVCGGKGPEGLERISLSYDALNHCEKISFLVNSPEKRDILDRMEQEWDLDRFPIQNISPPKKMYVLREVEA